MYPELYFVVILLIVSLLIAATRRRKRKVAFALLAAAWIITPVVALTWGEEPASAQAQVCGISQVTDTNGASVFTAPSISSDGSRIAFSSIRDFTGGNPDGNSEIWVYNVSANNFTQVTGTTGGVSSFASLIADGSRVVFLSNRNLTGGNADGNREVFLFNFASSTFTQVTNTILAAPVGLQEIPKISGSGTRVAFASNANITGGNPDNSYEYFLYDTTTGTTSQITNATGANFNFAPAINSDGTRIAILSTINPNGTNPDRNGEIFLYDTTTTSFTQLTNTTNPATFEPPTIDDTGTRVAFSGNYNPLTTNPDGDFEIFVYNTTSSTVSQLTNSIYSSFTATISGNGTYTAFTSNGDLTGGNSDLNNEIFVHNASTNTLTQLTNSSGGSLSQKPSVNSDGSRIAFLSSHNLSGNNGDGNEEVFLRSCGLVPTPPLVVNQPDDAGDGICDGTCTLRDAIDAANTLPSNDTITFAPFLSTVTLTDEITINGNNGSTEIKGLGADKLTIDGGPGLNRIFYSNFGNVTISNVTLTGGNGEGTPVTPGVNGTGGAIGANGGSLRLDRVHVAGNTAAIIGGGINLQNGALRITNSTISGNSSNTCGGLTAGGVTSTLNVANTTVSGNTATLHGGGLCTAGATANFRNATITGNSADQGGGIRTTGQVDLGNTIVAGNTAATAYPEMDIQSGASASSMGFNLVGDSAGDAMDTNTPVTYDITDITDEPPLLIALGNYGGTVPTRPLQIGSPAIDAGNDVLAVDPFDNSTLSHDQRGPGFPRSFIDVDIGAFEAQDVRYYVTEAADSPAGGACDENCSLREAAWLITSGTGSGTIDFARVFTSSTPIQLTGTSGIGLGTGDVTVAGYDARDIVIQGFTLGTLYVGGNVKISNVTIYNGIAPPGSRGGGIRVSAGSLTLDRVQVNANGNFESFGGGISFEGGTNHRILNSNFYFNSSTNAGCGAIIHSTGTLAIANSTFNANSANAGFGGGGAICVTGGNATLRNVTISGNTAFVGGGIHQTGGSIDIGNSIVAGNSGSGSNPPDINFAAGTFISSGNNLIGDSTGDAANTGNSINYAPSDLLDQPTGLGPLQYNGGTTLSMGLLSGVAIDAGSNALARDPFNNSPFLTDQRGFERYIGPSPPTVDIGAFEFGAAASYSAATAVGSNVNVAVGPASVTFAGVTQAGTTSAIPIDQAAAGPLPMGFTFGPGLPIYDISTTAVFTAPVTVCLQVPTVTVLAAFNALIIFHFENGALVNRTVSRNFSTKTICASVSSLSPFAVAQALAPTAAPVIVAGRVSSADGRAIYGASVTLTDASSGEIFASRSNSFGYFSFDQVPAGRDYILSATAKRYSFAPRLLNVNQDISDADLTAESSTENGKEL